MKAIIYTEYGSPEVLHLGEIDKPIPQDNELLIRNYATSINFGDLVARNFGNVTPREFNMPFLFYIPARLSFGWSKPRNPVLGSEFAGKVDAVGKDVTQFKVGDEVFGYLGQTMRGDAEYVCIAETGEVAHKPTNLTFEEAAVLPYGMITALNLLRKVDIQPGQKVLILGASGAIGSAAVQLAKQHGAEVTGVCGTLRIPYVKSLGADKVIDYTKQDFTQSSEQYDLIFDILGRGSFRRSRKVLKPHGRYLLASFKLKQLLQMGWTSLRGGQKVICVLSPEDTGDLPYIKELVETGQLKAAVDRCFPLEETAAAHRYAESGQKKGPIAISLAHLAG